jgi:(2Fe-2S) ferredoxin
MSYFKRHLFFCTHQRKQGETCCGHFQSQQMRGYAKQRTKDLGIAGPGEVRVNKAGCFGRCSEGPVAVVYPEAVWYTYIDKEDIDEIIEEHLVNGRTVDRLKI